MTVHLAGVRPFAGFPGGAFGSEYADKVLKVCLRAPEQES